MPPLLPRTPRLPRLAATALLAGWIAGGAPEEPAVVREAGARLVLVAAPAGTERAEALVAVRGTWPQAAGASTTRAELERWLTGRGASLEVLCGADELQIRSRCDPADAREVLARLWSAALDPALLAAKVGEPAATPLELARQLVELAGPGAGALSDPALAVRAVSLAADARIARWHGADRVAGLAASGELEARRAELARALSPPRPGPATDPSPPPPAPLPPGTYVAELAGAAAVELGLAGPPVAGDSPDAAALLLAAEALLGAGGEDALRSALSDALSRPVEAGGSFVRRLAGPSRVELWCRLPTDGLEPALAACAELAAALPTRLDEPALERARARLLDRSGLPGARLERAVLAELHGTGELASHEAERLRALRLDEARSALARALRPATVLARGPADALERALRERGLEPRRLPPPADALLARLFDAIGGRDAWARARFVELELEQVQGAAPPRRMHVWRDLGAPRMRIVSELPPPGSTFVLNEERAWSRSGERLIEFPAETHADLVARSWRELHCVLHQLATGARRARAVSPRRLALADGPCEGLWIELDDDGRPSRAGLAADGVELDYAYSDWRAFGELVAPARIEMPSAGWVREIATTRAHAELDAARFERP